MANPRKRGKRTHGDITGRNAVKQQADLAKEQKEEAARIATATQQEREAKDEVVRLVREPATPAPSTPEVETLDGSPPKPEKVDETIEAVVAQADQPAPQEVGGIVRQDGAAVVESATKTVRALFDLEDVTVGAGTLYTMEAGRKYEVPTNVAQHLAYKELVDIL